jgi:hypothetical protein
MNADPAASTPMWAFETRWSSMRGVVGVMEARMEGAEGAVSVR